MEFFIVGVFCVILGFCVSWFTGVDFWALCKYILLLPFIVIAVAGFSSIGTSIQTIYTPNLDLIASETIRSITSHFWNYLLYSLGGYIAGAFLGFLVPGHL